MNVRHLAKLSFAFAGLLALILIFGELLPRWVQEGSRQRQCRVLNNHRFAINEQIVWSQLKYLVTFRPDNGNLELSNWSADTQFEKSIQSQIGLFCEKPDYNCFLKKTLDGNPVHLEIKKFSPPVGIAQVSTKNLETRLFPFSWDSQKNLRVGEPLSFCGSGLTPEKTDLHLNSTQAVVFEPRRGLLGIYDLANLRGASLHSAGREPDKIFRVSNDGLLLPASCEGFHGESSHAQISLYKSHLVLKSNTGKLRVFDLSRGVSAVLKDFGSSQNVMSLNEKGFWSLSEERMITQMNYDGAVISKIELEKRPFTELTAMTFWEDKKQPLRHESSRWLSQLKFMMPGVSLPLEWKFLRTEANHSNIIPVSGARVVSVYQEPGQRALASVIECD